MNGILHIDVWVDGSCLRNPGGPGGWAFVLLAYPCGKRRVIDKEHASGREKSTTNNRMEMRAAMEALKFLIDNFTEKELRELYVTGISDSRYVVDGINIWSKAWAKKHWRKKKIRNRDLWIEFHGLQQKVKARWKWVRGHSGNRYNSLVDRLAGDAARGR